MKFVIRNMLFPTKLTSLINMRGLIDSVSLENHHNNRRNSGSHKWPKTFLGRCMCPPGSAFYLLLCSSNHRAGYFSNIGWAQPELTRTQINGDGFSSQWNGNSERFHTGFHRRLEILWWVYSVTVDKYTFNVLAIAPWLFYADIYHRGAVAISSHKENRQNV